MTTKKKHIGFYADVDVQQCLEVLDDGLKSRTINDAIRAMLGSAKQPHVAGLGRIMYSIELRDLCAMFALMGILASATGGEKYKKVLAAWEYADKMMALRESLDT